MIVMQMINAKDKKIEIIEYTGLESIQNVVGGLIEHALEIPSKENKVVSLYVNEEGLFREDLNYGFSFIIGNDAYSFIGNGCLCGVNTENGETITLDRGVDESCIKWLDEESVSFIRNSTLAQGPIVMPME